MKGANIKVIVGLFLLTTCMFLGSAFSSGFELKGNTRVSDEIYSETYHFHFRKVDSLIMANDHLYRNDLLYNLAVINYYWWRLISGEQNGKFADLISERIQTIDDKYLKRNTKIEDEQLFMLISIFVFNARVNLITNSYFAAISNLSKCYTFLKISFGHEIEYNPFFLTSGLYCFFSGLAKERVPLLSPFLNIYSTGNMDVGIKYIKKATSSDDWVVRQEAQYFLMKIYFDVYKNYPESTIYCDKLIVRYPENLLFHQYKFKNDLAIGKMANASSRMMLMESIAKGNDQLTIDEREYYIKQVRLEFNEYVKGDY